MSSFHALAARRVCVLSGMFAIATARSLAADPSPGVVSHIMVLSDKIEDVSSLEAWKQSFIKPGMTDQQKAIAIWETVVKFRHQDPPPNEFLANEGHVHDPIKAFNVYGYGQCCCASANIEALARYAGLESRGWGIAGHSVPEIKIGGKWCMFDASLINYFQKKEGNIAGVEEIGQNISDWYMQHPDYRNNNDKLYHFMLNEGWRKGPDVLSYGRYESNGWLPAATHGWYSNMQEFGSPKTNFVYEYGAAIGYEVNIQLRPGERLIRNWSNKGLHINMREGSAPGCLNMPVGTDQLRYSPGFGDIAPGRVGNGMLEYILPLANGTFRSGMLKAENLATSSEEGTGPAVHVKDSNLPAELSFRMPSSYVYLSGMLHYTPTLKSGGSITVFFSDNNGLDWKQVDRATESGARKVDMGSLVFRRYDYRLKFIFQGGGTGVEALKITHDIQHSQRALPAIAQGANQIHFLAGAREGTITVQGAINGEVPAKNLMLADFHPIMESLDPKMIRPLNGAGSIGLAVETPGDITRLRVGVHYRARDAKEGWMIEASFDAGKTWKPIGELEGPYVGHSKYFVFQDVPARSRSALVRFSGHERNTTILMDLRIDADYLEPHGGLAPVKVTYAWDEKGQRKTDVHLTKSADESYSITCNEKPDLKSITMELE